MTTATAAPAIAGRNYIAGRWRTPANPSLESHNPAHWSEVLGRFPKSSAEEVAQAVAAARAPYPAWRRTSRIHRGELFDNLAQLVKREVESLAELMARECGKVITEC